MAVLDTLPGLTPLPACRTLADLAAAVPADEAIVELGVYRGRTACWLGEGARRGQGARVWAIDPWDLPGNKPPAYRGGSARTRRARAAFSATATRQAAEAALSTAGLAGLVTLVRGFAQQAAADWAGPAVGLLYVDGDHTAAGADIDAWWPHLAATAVIVADDYMPRFPDVMRDVDRLAGSGLVRLEVVHGRLAILRRAA